MLLQFHVSIPVVIRNKRTRRERKERREQTESEKREQNKKRTKREKRTRLKRKERGEQEESKSREETNKLSFCLVVVLCILKMADLDAAVTQLVSASSDATGDQAGADEILGPIIKNLYETTQQQVLHFGLFCKLDVFSFLFFFSFSKWSPFSVLIFFFNLVPSFFPSYFLSFLSSTLMWHPALENTYLSKLF